MGVSGWVRLNPCIASMKVAALRVSHFTVPSNTRALALTYTIMRCGPQLHMNIRRKPSEIPLVFPFFCVLSSIPTTKNKIHHLCAEIRHDSDHPFREKPLCTREVG